MNIALSILDDVFRRAQEFARILLREPRSVTSTLDQLIDELAPAPDPWLSEAGRQTLKRSEW
jgi:hypothetical protein